MNVGAPLLWILLVLICTHSGDSSARNRSIPGEYRRDQAVSLRRLGTFDCSPSDPLRPVIMPILRRQPLCRGHQYCPTWRSGGDRKVRVLSPFASSRAGGPSRTGLPSVRNLCEDLFDIGCCASLHFKEFTVARWRTCTDVAVTTIRNMSSYSETLPDVNAKHCYRSERVRRLYPNLTRDMPNISRCCVGFALPLCTTYDLWDALRGHVAVLAEHHQHQKARCAAIIVTESIDGNKRRHVGRPG